MKIICGLLFLCLFLSACQSKSPEANYTVTLPYENKVNPTPKPSSKVYKQTEVGMTYGDFIELCGDERGKDYTHSETSAGSVDSVTFEYSNLRLKKNCWGKFTFVNDKLDSIFQN